MYIQFLAHELVIFITQAIIVYVYNILAYQALHEKEPYMIAVFSLLIVQKWFEFHQTNA